MTQGKAGWWIAGVCAVVVFISIGYGMGKRANPTNPNPTLTPAGAPLSTIQIEPIKPHEELAAITANPAPPTVPTPGPSEIPAATPSIPTLPIPSREDSARVREIQLALKAAGFDPGPADGQLGTRTKTAIRDFQTANGLTADGKVGPRTWSKLESYLKQASNPSSPSNPSND